jgi:ketosteroid isomerase-like protein
MQGSAAEAALKYYDNYNNKRFDKVVELIAEDCVYEGRWGGCLVSAAHAGAGRQAAWRGIWADGTGASACWLPHLTSPPSSADLIYQEPFRGRAAIAAYLQKVEKIVPPDIKFVVEDITEGGRTAGVRW